MVRKKIIFVTRLIDIEGAGRVMSLLANNFVNNGYDVTLLLTHQRLQKLNHKNLDNDIKLISVEDEIDSSQKNSYIYMLIARIMGKVVSFLTGNQDYALIKRYAVRNHSKIKWLKSYFKINKNAVLIAFLYDAIFLTLLSRNKSNRVIISERVDPSQSLGSKTDIAFFRFMFPKADAMVFQSPDVKAWYKTNMNIDGTVIFNPIRKDLPEPYHGVRNKHVVNFCRISPQKNLLLLIDAFELLHDDFPDVELWIYGNKNATAIEYMRQFKSRIAASKYKEFIHHCPAIEDIHSKIIKDAMFVSSSDFEGMSNSMLEAMAIGLPVVCTDCPAGGARAVIQDHENGLLVPIKDANRLYLAMKEIIEKPELAEKLSTNAVRIRETQSEMAIMRQWQALISFQKEKEK